MTAPHAEDLAEVAAALGLSAQKVAALHPARATASICMDLRQAMSFSAACRRELAISRRPAPRPPIPPGAVLIAGGQALIASIAMPTGWYDIGRTPAALFDPKRSPTRSRRHRRSGQFRAGRWRDLRGLAPVSREGLPVARERRDMAGNSADFARRSRRDRAGRRPLSLSPPWRHPGGAHGLGGLSHGQSCAGQ